MIKFKDYTCPGCGHTLSDIAIDSNEEEKERKCPVCSTVMNPCFGGLAIKTNSRTERSYPTHLLGGGERARFDR